MIKKIALMVITSMLFMLFTACGNENTQDDDVNNEISTQDVTESSQIPDESEEIEISVMPPDIPEDLSYSDTTFTFLMNAQPYWQGRSDIYAEELTGDPLNDAIYTRNQLVEERFGIKIEEIAVYGNDSSGKGPGYSRITRAVNAGDGTFDAAIVCGYEASTLAYNGFLKNLSTVPYIDLEKPWWDQRANQDLTIQNKVFMTTGDISWLINDASYGILFNKKLVTDYQLPNLYELVKNNEWTIDKWAEISKLVSSDLDGNGVRDTNDLYGSVIWDDAIMGIVNASGEKCATVNSANGEIELTLNTDRVISTLDKYLEAVSDKDSFFAYQRHSVVGNQFFADNKALFYMQLIEEVHFLRNMETDFGILPFPKLDEHQEGYPTSITPFSSLFFVIPSYVDDVEMSGAVVEQMAYLSREYVRPAYFDITLKVKGTRDEESVEMLNIILENRVFDLGWYYNLGKYTDGLLNLFRNNQKDFVSMYEGNESVAIGQLEQINSAYKNLE